MLSRPLDTKKEERPSLSCELGRWPLVVRSSRDLNQATVDEHYD